jgi:hypothetical protein
MRPEIRMNRLVVTSLLAAFVCGVTGAALAADPTSFAEAKAQAARENKILVVDFYTDW